MIATVDISIQAANPSLPLFPMRAFEGSPSSIRIRNVPKRIGDWVIDKVYFAVAYPDNSTQTIECKLVGGVYVGTIAGCDTIGNVKNGYSIFADGKDENGNAVTDYCLGKGDIQILDARGITQPLQNTTFVQILSAHPATPNDGDMWYENDAWYVWQNGQAMPLGDDSAIIGNLSERVDELSAELSSKQDELTDAEQYALSDTVYDLATKFYFTDNTTSAFSWNKEEVTLEDFIEAGLVDENGTWIKQPRIIEVGKPVSYFHANAFAGCTNLYSVVFYGKIYVDSIRNYPWGISNTSIIQPFYNASRYWVEQKGYASTYTYQSVAILPFGTRVATLQPYAVNNLNFNSQAATFRVDVGGSAGKMRDMYFVFTVPSDSQPMTWNTYFDRFEGGDAASVAPTSGTNIYHIYEYASGHFAVEKFDNAYTKAQVDSQMLSKADTDDLSAYATTADVQLAERGYTPWSIAPTESGSFLPTSLIYSQAAGGWMPANEDYPEGVGELKGDANSTSLIWGYGSSPFNPFVATRIKLEGYQLGTQADKPLAGASDLSALRDKAAADATLSAVYSDTPAYGDDWRCEPSEYEGSPITIVWDATGEYWQPYWRGDPFGGGKGVRESTSLYWDDDYLSYAIGGLSAYRRRSDVIKYILGDQIDKPIVNLSEKQLSAIDSVVSGDYLTRKETEAGYTEWVITPPYFDEGIPFDLTYQEEYGWVLGIRFEGGGEAIGFSYGPQDVTTLTYTNIENVGTVTATRCRITPTKTSQLSNDGSDGVHPFATIEDLSTYELKADLSNNVSAIVTQTSPVAEFTFAFVSGNPVDISLYRAEKMDASDEPRYNIYYGNSLAIVGALLADDMSYPQQLQDDLNGCIIDVTKTNENRNVFGFASYDWVKNYIDQYMQEHQS